MSLLQIFINECKTEQDFVRLQVWLVDINASDEDFELVNKAWGKFNDLRRITTACC